MSDDVMMALLMFGALIVIDAAMVGVCIVGSQPDARRNGLVGIRLPATMASDEAWVAGHAAAKRYLWPLAIGSLAVGALLLLLLGVVPSVAGWVEFAWFIVSAVVFVAVMCVIASQAARQVTNDLSDE